MAVHEAAAALFDEMPEVVEDAAPEACGAGQTVTAPLFYCTTPNQIIARAGALEAADASYRMAHLLGHAIQVRHGIADIALREVRARPSEEVKLRGMVTRQVECLAGALIARAGLDVPDLAELFAGVEPHTGSHWGRTPLRIGPQVSIGVAARQTFLDHGYAAADFAACAVGEVPVGPLLEALKG